MKPAAQLSLALPKGRLLDDARDLFVRAGYGIAAVSEKSRKLIFDCDAARGLKLRVLLVKPTDVGTYVARGVCDLGVAGLDKLAEQNHDVYEMLDLGIGRCRLAVAGPRGGFAPKPPDEPLRVATLFPRLARDYFARQGRVTDIVELHGSVEIAPTTGLADCIVDLVESGETLRQNNLEPYATVLDVTARLIVNRAALKVRREPIAAMIAALTKVVQR